MMLSVVLSLLFTAVAVRATNPLNTCNSTASACEARLEFDVATTCEGNHAIEVTTNLAMNVFVGTINGSGHYIFFINNPGDGWLIWTGTKNYNTCWRIENVTAMNTSDCQLSMIPICVVNMNTRRTPFIQFRKEGITVSCGTNNRKTCSCGRANRRTCSLEPRSLSSFSFNSPSSTPLTVSPTPIPSILYCEEDEQWPRTMVGVTANESCYRGTVNATRVCNRGGVWGEVDCQTSFQFQSILSQISMSPMQALNMLSEQLVHLPLTQTIILLDTILTNSSSNNVTLQFIEELLDLVNDILQRRDLFDDPESGRSVGSQLLLTLDTFALNLVDQNINLSTDAIALAVQHIISLTDNDTVTAIANESNVLTLPAQIFIRNIPVTVASFVYRNLSLLLSPQTEQKLISPVVSSAINCTSSCNTTDLTEPVTISFNLSHQQISNKSNLTCVFWKFIISNNTLPSGYWDSEGCIESTRDQLTVTCQCDHLTHFAILLSPQSTIDQVHQEILTTIGLVLVPISLLCMLLVILTYTCMRSLWNMRNYIHIILCCNLFLSQLLFVIGIEQTDNQSVCSAISVVLQYMFLVTFMWMLMEGVVLYVALVKVFIKHPKRYMIVFTVLSYGIPAVYMIIIVPIGYLVGTSDHSHYLYYQNETLVACWLDYQSGFIWTFIAPVIIIILTNIGFFIMAIVIMRRHQKKQVHKTQVENAKHWIKASLSLTVVMGIGWIANVLFFSDKLLFVAYIMTVFIAGQGIVIFLLYVPLSKHVREAYLKWWRNKQANSSVLSKLTFLTGTLKPIDSTEANPKKMARDNVYGEYTLGTFEDVPDLAIDEKSRQM